MFTGQDSGLDGGTVGDGLIGIDAPGGFLAIEKLLDELLDLGDTSGASYEYDLVDLVLRQIRILKDLLDWLQSSAEKILQTTTRWNKKGEMRRIM